MIGWNFPLSNHGPVIGLNDAGIETFRGNPLESLAREIIQNSLDAKHSDVQQPVKVCFELHDLPTDKFPSKENFMYVLNSAVKYWENNKETKEFFKNALKIMKKDKLPVLKIRDYNTTGLTGSNEERGSNWHNLVKAVGSSDKNAGAGGSFGIGKHAPFACSQIRTVFYATKDIKGKTAFQGVAKLVTHKNKEGEPTQGTGYYGIKKHNKEILDVSKVDEFFRRSRVGTDIFIPGFKMLEDWNSKIIKSVLENFFAAVHDKRLVVKVEDIIINSNTLSELLEEYIKDDQDCLADKYYNSLVSSETEYFEENFENLGNLELYVLPKKNYPKRVAMVRGTGMKIYDKGHFRTPLRFAGVLFAKGEDLNEFLRSLEPPSHDKWEPERHEDPKLARKLRGKLYSWLNDMVSSISHNDEAEELDVDGISQYLPDDLDDAPLEEQSSKEVEGEKTIPKNIQVKRRRRRPAKEVITANAETAASTGEEESSEGGSNDSDNDNGGSSSTNSGGGRDSNQGDQSAKTNKPIKLKNIRVFCVNPNSGTYNVLFESSSSGEGFLFFNIVGEVDKDKALIESAEYKKTGEAINIESEDKIGPLKFKEGIRYSLLITLKDSIRCALEVALDEN